MRCHFCKTEMIESNELCWHIGEPIKQETGELYSKKHTCPKCGHWERSDFRNLSKLLKRGVKYDKFSCNESNHNFSSYLLHIKRIKEQF